MFRVVMKLSALQQPLKQIHKHRFGNIIQQVDEARPHLLRVQERLQQDITNAQIHMQEMVAREQFMIKSKAAQAYMIQHSKATWIKESDDNTSYFHGLIWRRTYQTRIHDVTPEQGSPLTEYGSVVSHLVDFYKGLLGTKGVKSERVQREVVELGPILNF